MKEKQGAGARDMGKSNHPEATLRNDEKFAKPGSSKVKTAKHVKSAHKDAVEAQTKSNGGVPKKK